MTGQALGATMEWPVSVEAVLGWNDRYVLLRNDRSEWELPGGLLAHGEQPAEDGLGDPGSLGGPTDDPSCGVTIETAPIGSGHQGTFDARADGGVDGSCGPRGERDQRRLGNFAEDPQGAMAIGEREII